MSDSGRRSGASYAEIQSTETDQFASARCRRPFASFPAGRGAPHSVRAGPACRGQATRRRAWSQISGRLATFCLRLEPRQHLGFDEAAEASGVACGRLLVIGQFIRHARQRLISRSQGPRPLRVREGQLSEARRRSHSGFRSVCADWEKLGRKGGPIRNQLMLDEGRPDLVVAFPGRRGAADMVRRARTACIEVIEVDVKTRGIGNPRG